MCITEQEYKKACERLEEIIDLVEESDPEDNPLLRGQYLIQIDKHFFTS